MGKDGERASGIKGHAPDGARVDVVLIQDALDAGADASPDVVRGLFLEAELVNAAHRVSFSQTLT